MKVILSKAAQISLARSNKRDLIASKIRALANDPASMNQNVTKLKGRLQSRLRVQDWRVLFRIEDATLIVDDIGPRGAVYED